MRQLLLILIGATMSCTFINNNPLDESGSSYDPPRIAIDEQSVHNGDTVYIDTVNLILLGNRPQSLFRIRIGDLAWSDWSIKGTYNSCALSGGRNVIKLDTKYRGGRIEFLDSIVIFVQINKSALDSPIVKDTIKDTVSIPTKTKTYRVLFLGNGNDSGVVPSDTGRYASGTRYLVQGQVYKRDCEFLGWSVIISDSLKILKIGDEFTIDSSNVLLTAQWRAKSIYSITYNGNNWNSGDIPQKTSHRAGTPVEVLSKGTLSKTGNAFLCWNTDSSGSGIDYYPGNTIVMNDNVSLYARWVKNTYKIEYICMDNDFGKSPHDSTYEFASDVIIDSTSVKKTGYTFMGWVDSKGVEYPVGKKFKMLPEDLILYVKWDNPKGMFLIPSKNEVFQMGGMDYSEEKPIHYVKFTKNVWFDTTEVTQKSYATVMSTVYPLLYQTPDLWTSSSGFGDNFPAYDVSWFEAILYCNAITKLTGSTDTVYTYTEVSGKIGSISDKCMLKLVQIDLNKKGFRLPTEAEWEFAAKGGSSIIKLNDKDLERMCWYLENSGNALHEVAKKGSNNFKLHDMLGNLREWVNDWYYTYSDSIEIAVDPMYSPVVLIYNTGRIYRGGCYTDDIEKVRIPFRYYQDAESSNLFIGFRCCLPAVE
jgi:formylglycine-generating enzyme